MSKCKAADPSKCWKHGNPEVRKKSKKIIGGKSNVSKFEATFKELFKEFNNAEENVSLQELLEIPDAQRPTVFRGVDSEKSLKNIFVNLKTSLQNGLKTKNMTLEGNDNNRDGSDLYDNETNTNIELKLGEATDLNVGLEAMSHILGEDLIEMLPSITNRERWREAYLESPEEGIKLSIKEHKEFFDLFVANFNSKTGQKLDVYGQQMMLSYWTGNINTKDSTDHVRRWKIKPDGNWDEETKNSTQGEWVYDKAEVAVQKDGTSRLKFWIANSETEDKLFIVYNYKNTYRSSKLGIEAEAKIGLGSGSFNGWWK